ncbi:M23 family metallopeptidase [Paenibacillus lutrae]|uniref:Peptidoglycan DD-metalloendopeptidase family protein n=1 Tax=Paenibacillus lutrae TaxID=2078573 RepID=A0A7X3FL83_9BACL|nr:M23 family metallopeptidase [Paenibacillus lutrae]MVP01790.1 peptidoglycan DD-metalloendopeptidase family protein [Paenibacillus lutrae]
MKQAIRRNHRWLAGCMVLCLLALPNTSAAAGESKVPAVDPTRTADAVRKDLMQKVGEITGIPWTLLAAVDRYEHTLNKSAKKTAPPNRLIGIDFTELTWVGMMNPDHEDTDPGSIAFFGGVGKDGSGDGLADRSNDLDRLASMATLMLRKGRTPEDIRISLWDYYNNTRSVQRIDQFSAIYEKFGTLSLHQHAFPLPLKAQYSYRSTWGASRGWGGFRIHEGTDLFAGYGVPVRSTAYGYIEVKGWNPYGGWRIGIRDLDNVYHYYAHLSGFDKKLQEGDVVQPGQVIGWVGSSGYGKPGTSGKFPPHLHFGMYKDRGLTDWPFDPYPSLKRYENEDRKKQKSTRK